MSTALAPLHLTVPSLWDLVREVRAKVGEHLASVDPELRDASIMAASELVENAVKYGRRATGWQEATLRLEQVGESLEVAVISGVGSPEVAARTIERVKQIRAAKDKRALYIARLREMMAHPSGSGPTELGLLRVSAEGEFELSCFLVGSNLHVVAKRSLS